MEAYEPLWIRSYPNLRSRDGSDFFGTRSGKQARHLRPGYEQPQLICLVSRRIVAALLERLQHNTALPIERTGVTKPHQAWILRLHHDPALTSMVAHIRSALSHKTFRGRI